ncbi:MAG: hypothetical protein ACRCX2_15165 [Paraclostridium sp.]
MDNIKLFITKENRYLTMEEAHILLEILRDRKEILEIKQITFNSYVIEVSNIDSSCKIEFKKDLKYFYGCTIYKSNKSYSELKKLQLEKEKNTPYGE